jgi:hypothetical protein
MRHAAVHLLAAVMAASIVPWERAVGAQTDLDALMKQVLARRDDNWKKLQQYVLDEHEEFELRGPTRLPMWGEKRDYTWYIRDGFFVRSPVRANGATVSEGERRKYEADYLEQMRKRETRSSGGEVVISGSGIMVNTPDDDPDWEAIARTDTDGVLKQTRQPQFISSAYFLRFRFDEGKYALVGRETVEGRDTLRIEYYPSNLFRGTDRRRQGRREPSAEDKARDAEFRRLMNKVALVTLWVDPAQHQIVKYTFDNIGFEFLPGQWLIHVEDVTASMTMSQPFAETKDVWLPRHLEFAIGMSLASGRFDARYVRDFSDYRRADVTSKVGIKER